MKNVLLLALAMVALTACRTDNEADLYNPNPDGCDTVAVGYAATVQPIIQQNCYTCHNQANYQVAGAGILLEGHAALVLQANNGALVGSIDHQPGFAAMPPTGVKIDACDINKIKAWVAAGAPNN